MKALRSILSFSTLGALGVALAGCPDPPAPSLAIVSIHNTSNDDATSITYVRYDNGVVAGDASKGIAVGDGLSVLLTLGRTIADPPSKKAEATALTERAFKLTVEGDVFTAALTPTSSRIILSSVKPGTGTLVFSVDGATGTVRMPVQVVDQAQVPPDVRPPDLPPPSAAEAGTTDGGTE